jgi:hypothetical protein
MLDLADDGGLQVGLGIPGLFRQTQKFQHQRLFEQVLGLTDDLPLSGKLANAVFVAAEGQAFIQAAVELALEFAKGPVLAGSLNFVEASLISLLNAQQKNIVGPAQAERAFGLSRSCLENLQWYAFSPVRCGVQLSRHCLDNWPAFLVSEIKAAGIG